jgi:hypothetical protein
MDMNTKDHVQSFSEIGMVDPFSSKENFDTAIKTF